jgi:hypothetical protein
MGAEFILMGVPAAEIDDARKKRLLEIVGGVTEDSEDCDFQNFEDVEEYRNALAKAVEFIGRADRSREVAVFGLPGAQYEVLLTGGMSWGDAPTDAFGSFEVLNSCALLIEQLEVWATDDFRDHDG